MRPYKTTIRSSIEDPTYSMLLVCEYDTSDIVRFTFIYSHVVGSHTVLRVRPIVGDESARVSELGRCVRSPGNYDGVLTATCVDPPSTTLIEVRKRSS